jgi:FtsP/CotA-like multicopper oxidase with cupredoxin domain
MCSVTAMLSRRKFLVGCAVAGGAGRAAARVLSDDLTELRVARSEGVARFNEATPGPVIRARRGDTVKVRLINGLDEPTAIHWHGVRLRNAMDGAPPLTQPAVAPGETFDYSFVVPDAGTFFYHASYPRQAGELFGALIVAEPQPQPPAVDHDLALVFAEAPRVAGAARRFTINGAPALDLAVRRNARLRLRFINAAPSAVMDARIDGHRCVVMALDGEPAEPFAARDSRIVLAPGNRADVFVDAVAAAEVAPIVFAADGEVPRVRLVYGASAGDVTRAVPADMAPLADNPLPARMNFTGALRATLPIGAGNPDRLPAAPLFIAARGRTVMMALDNRDAAEHVVHIHGHHVRLLDRLDDGWKPYWLDTIVAGPQQVTRIAFVADNPGRWLIEQRALGAFDGAPTWFQVD